MAVTLTFYGGAGGVTGSKYLLEVNGKRVLLDCGVFQGLPDMRERNRSFPFPPESIDHVILSHAHLDHCGMLPLLVGRGFTGNIFATPATKDVTGYMLADAAGIEEQDADYRLRHHVGAPDEREPLFTRRDIPAVMERFVAVDYVRNGGTWQPVTDGLRLKLYDAGHILGSAVIVVEYQDKGETHYLGFTGDLGPSDMPLLYDPQVPAESISAMLMETTYGGRQHVPLEAAMDRLAEAIVQVHRRGGKIIVPAFSLGRTQLFVYVVHKLTDSGRIPRLPIYVDSPLATDLTQVYKKHSADYDTQTWQDFVGPDHRPLAFRNLTYIRSVDQSKRLNTQLGPFMIISASGMMTAGRVVHHLRHSIADERNAVFITGYQAKGTLGRRLLEGAQRVELYGDYFPVRAQMFLFNEFSAHADSQQLQAYAERINGLRQVMLVHGEPDQTSDFQAQLLAAHPTWDVHRPEEGETIEVAV